MWIFEKIQRTARYVQYNITPGRSDDLMTLNQAVKLTNDLRKGLKKAGRRGHLYLNIYGDGVELHRRDIGLRNQFHLQQRDINWGDSDNRREAEVLFEHPEDPMIDRIFIGFTIAN